MIRIRHLISSSLWITVLIVRVGCIIEAHATPLETGVDLTSKESREISSMSSRHVGVKKKIPSSSRRLFTSRSLSNSQIKSTTSMPISSMSSLLEDDDSCSGKADGYFPNYGSDCTSYYFCAAGYQITYVCPPDSRFNEKSKKCEEDVICLSKGHQNLCENLPNGYYSKELKSPKYFYCFNNAKVIDLMCDYGKIYDGTKCVLAIPGKDEEEENRKRLKDLENVSCKGRLNGFYPIPNSGCSKYYFCINGVKTELRCETRLVFNGQVCVHPLRYKCPLDTNNTNTITDHKEIERQEHEDHFDSTSMTMTTVS